MVLATGLLVGGLTPVVLGAGPASAGDAAPAVGAAAPVAAAAGPVSNAGPAGDTFVPTMRAAVALVIVGLFAATRSRTRAPR